MIYVMKKGVNNRKDGDMTWKGAILKAGKGILTMLPIILGVILLLGLFKAYVTQEMIRSLFHGVPLIDGVIGSIMGSILAGNPITSYLIGHELLMKQVSLFAVTALIVSWVTVGMIQLPAEMAALGKMFSLLRNGISFLLSFIVAGLVTILMGVFY